MVPPPRQLPSHLCAIHLCIWRFRWAEPVRGRLLLYVHAWTKHCHALERVPTERVQTVVSTGVVA